MFRHLKIKWQASLTKKISQSRKTHADWRRTMRAHQLFGVTLFLWIPRISVYTTHHPNSIFNLCHGRPNRYLSTRVCYRTLCDKKYKKGFLMMNSFLCDNKPDSSHDLHYARSTKGKACFRRRFYRGATK